MKQVTGPRGKHGLYGMKLSLHLLAWCLAAFCSVGTGLVRGAEKPNVIVFLVDDLGWNHLEAPQATLGTSPGEYRTPAIARLAAEGVSFPYAYAQPNCAPTRAALLTGQYPPRSHNGVYAVGNLNRHGGGGISREQARFAGPPQRQEPPLAALTVAEALRRNGYATAHIGKFHIGGHTGPETLPEQRGFDINLGGHRQGHQPVCFASKENGTWKFKGLGRRDFDRWAAPYDAAYLREKAFPASLEGSPKHVCDALGDALEETVRKLAAGGAPFYLQFHPYAVHTPIQARPDLRAAARPRASSRAQAEYLGFIASLDINLARLLARLEDPDGDGDTKDSIAENTLVLFTSDNGGAAHGNLPLRGAKGEFTEGGLRVPLIARWKNRLPAGKTSRRVVHSVDFYPTLLELAGGAFTPPAETHPLDGESFAREMLEPGRAATRGPVCYLFPGYLDSRAQPGAWILDEVAGKRYKAGYDYESGRWSLHDLGEPQGEERDLAASHPEILRQLARRLDAWLRQDHPTWQPAYPLRKDNGTPAGPPPPPP